MGIVNEYGNMLIKKGYDVKIFNTKEFKNSLCYNPFVYIKNEADILTFVKTLIANTNGDNKGGGGDDFWVKAETMLYQALIGYIWYEFRETEPKRCNINTVVEMINMMEVREDDETFENAVDIMFKKLQYGDGYVVDEKTKVVTQKGKNPQPNHFAVRQYVKYKLAVI